MHECHSWVLPLAATFQVTALPCFFKLHLPPLTSLWNQQTAASLNRMLLAQT